MSAAHGAPMGVQRRRQAIPSLPAVRGLAESHDANAVPTGIDLDVGPGEVPALAGENGAGQSTLMRVVGGYAAPAANDVTLGGKPHRHRACGAARLGLKSAVVGRVDEEHIGRLVREEPAREGATCAAWRPTQTG